MTARHTTVILTIVAVVSALGAAPTTAAGDSATANGILVFQRVDWLDIIDGSGVMTIPPSGGAVRHIAGSDFERPSWSPDGSRLVASKLAHPGREIWVMDPDGSNATQIVAEAAHNAYAPKWSADGTRIAFDRWPTSGDEVTDVYVMNADGSAVALAATGASLIEWSPDGSTLLVESFASDGSTSTRRLEAVNADGTGRTPLVEFIDPDFLEGWTWSPAWSPDGTKIAFCRVMGILGRTAGGPDVLPTTDIWVMNADGSDHANLTSSATPSECGPAWSPDGKTIAYSSEGEVWLMNADGSTKANLTNTVTPAAERGPVWSPDGSQIAYSRNDVPVEEQGDSGITSIWVMDTDGSHQTKLTSGDHWDYSLAWQQRAVAGIGMVDTAAGEWHLPHTSFYYGNPGDIPMLGDWDCDGTETPGLHRQSDGYVYLRNSNTQGVADVRYFFGDPSDIPLAGDFNGDGCDTVSLYRPSEGKVYVHNALGAAEQGLGAAELSYFFGDPADKPFVGDFDGDGVDTIGLHRETTGEVYFRNSHTPGVADVHFVYGDPGDVLVSHEWRGNGFDSIAVFRPADARLYFRFANTQGVADATLQWGNSDWWPIAGNH